MNGKDSEARTKCGPMSILYDIRCIFNFISRQSQNGEISFKKQHFDECVYDPKCINALERLPLNNQNAWFSGSRDHVITKWWFDGPFLGYEPGNNTHSVRG